VTAAAGQLDDLHGEAASRLLSVGQRYTANRRMLIEALADVSGPVTIAGILEGRSDLPVSSAYRSLTVLERAGLVQRVVTGEERARYELAEELTDRHHHHLVCSSCASVEDVTIPPELERDVDRILASLAGRSGFTAVSHQLDLVGLCRVCG
jgi:Fe2+ or Zn2+ uptake regulation protein